jgi:hypothetical protein
MAIHYLCCGLGNALKGCGGGAARGLKEWAFRAGAEDCGAAIALTGGHAAARAERWKRLAPRADFDSSIGKIEIESAAMQPGSAAIRATLPVIDWQ